jgi:hypothetical protein
MPPGELRHFINDNAGIHIISDQSGDIVFSWSYSDGSMKLKGDTYIPLTGPIHQCYSCSEFCRVAPEGCWAYESFLHDEWDPDHGYCIDQGRYIRISLDCSEWRLRITDDEEDCLDILSGESFI